MNKEILMEDEEKLFWADARAAAQSIKHAAEERELKAGRATVPGLGGYSTQALNLSDSDKRFLNYVRHGVQVLTPDERKALVEDSTGQYLVSPAIEAEVERRLQEEVTIRQLAAKRTLNKDRIQIRSIGEATVSWGRLETGSNIPESDLTPGTPRTGYVADLYGLTKIGEDELEDSDVNLINILSDSFARAIAEKENEGFIRGAGWDSGQEPDGILLDTTLIANAKTTAAKSAIIVEDCLDMVYSCPPAYRKRGSFVVHSSTELALRKLRAGGSTTTDGPFLWQPSVQEGKPNTFLGYGIYTDDQMGEIGGDGTALAIFGDFSMGYQILDRSGIGIQRLSELYAEAGLVGFKIHQRVGGYVKNPSNKALVLLIEHS
jgi:HK97 family phage major capsid protein